MVRFLVCAIVSTLLCGVLAGCGQQAPKAAPKGKPPAPAAAPAPKTPPAEVKPAPAQPKGFVDGHPVLARLGLSAEQVGKINSLAAEAAKLPTAERGAKVRAALNPDQQAKFDAGLKLLADYDGKVSKLQQANYTQVMAAPVEKRRELVQEYRQKRSVLDAEVTKLLDEAVGKGPAVSDETQAR